MSTMPLRSVLMAAILLSLGTLAGCGSESIETRESTATTGKQLMDLQKAYEAGVLSQEEYEKQRKMLLDH